MNPSKRLIGTGRLCGKWSFALAVLILFLILPAGLTRAEDSTDMKELRAQPFHWVLDQDTGKAYRGADRPLFSGHGFVKKMPAGYSPQQFRRAYGIDRVPADGSGQVVAIVNAFHHPNVAADLKKYINTFGLKPMYGLPGRPSCTVAGGPHPCFEVAYAEGVQPAVDDGWALESALDVQMVHAVAPDADILLMEAMDNSLIELFYALEIVSTRASVVTMSWGVPEFYTEAEGDCFFDIPGVTFVAASGDIGNRLQYPSVSSKVLAVGGTSLFVDRLGRRTQPEIGWAKSGGGISRYIEQPAYQVNFPMLDTGGKRALPDVAMNADPLTGFAVYFSPSAGTSGWMTVGGTSAGSPIWAALTALANELRGENLSSNNPVSCPVYEAAARPFYGATYLDVTAGTNGGCGEVCTAVKGFDCVTGLGVPRSQLLLPYMALEDRRPLAGTGK